MSPNENRKTQKLSMRKQGVLAIVISIIFAAIFIGWPIMKAHNQASEITTYMTGVGLTIFSFIVGIIFLIFGEKAKKLFTFDPQNISGSQFAILLFFAILGLIGFLAVGGILSSLGYQ